MDQSRLPRRWFAALLCFVVAGSTGTLYRFGLLNGLPPGLGLVNIRHAHSHLMYFGWVTPALMLLITSHLPLITGRQPSPWFQRVTTLTIFLALVAYIVFFFYGYQPAEINGWRVPLSVFASTFNVLAWYAFAYLYFRGTWKAVRSRPLRFWDASLIFLVLASMGAWGIAIIDRLQIDNPFWPQAMTHLFLDLFSEGWFVLATLGLAYSLHPVPVEAGKRAKLAGWGEQLIVIGLPVVFLLALPVSLVPGEIRALAAAGGLLVAIGILFSVGALWSQVPRRLSSWRPPLALLTLKTVVGLAMLLPVSARWAQQNNLRILYLHLLLLGFVSLGLFVTTSETWGRYNVPGQRWLVVTILLVLLSLVPLTGIWPTLWRGVWTFQLAGWVSFWPVLVVTGMLVVWLTKNRKPAPVDTSRNET